MRNLFTSDYRYYGDHANMTDDLLIANGGFFDTVYDAFFTASIVGFMDGTISIERGSKNSTKTIFGDKFSNEYDKTKFIIRTLILSDTNFINNETEKIDRALRNIDDKDTAKINREYIEKYALRGIEILHDRFISSKKNTDVVSFVNELIEEYTSKENNYESIHNLIIELSKSNV